MDKEDVVCMCIYMYVYTYIYVYIYILLSHKQNEILPFEATCMDLGIIILSEVSQAEKDKYYMMPLICEI